MYGANRIQPVKKRKVQAQLQKPDQLLTQMESQLSVGVEFEEASVIYF